MNFSFQRENSIVMRDNYVKEAFQNQILDLVFSSGSPTSYHVLGYSNCKCPRNYLEKKSFSILSMHSQFKFLVVEEHLVRLGI